MPQRISFTPNVQPINLPPVGVLLPYNNEEGWVSGFGWAIPDGVQAQFLQRTFQRVTNATRCALSYAITVPNHFCAFDNLNSNVCFGDFGSGFVVDYRGVDTLVGLASITTASCNTVDPAAFTRISPYREWIRTNTGA